MKTELLFAVASIMLVGAVIVFALPTQVQAKKTEWCTFNPLNSGGPDCFNAKGQCEKFFREQSDLQRLPCQDRPT